MPKTDSALVQLHENNHNICKHGTEEKASSTTDANKSKPQLLGPALSKVTERLYRLTPLFTYEMSIMACELWSVWNELLCFCFVNMFHFGNAS